MLSLRTSLVVLTLSVALLVTTVMAFSGRGTWFNVGLGACGWNNNNNQLVAALNSAQYSGGAYCGHSATVYGPNGQVTVTIVDECPGCGYGSLDLSPAAFSKLANLGVGDIPISWNWN